MQLACVVPNRKCLVLITLILPANENPDRSKDLSMKLFQTLRLRPDSRLTYESLVDVGGQIGSGGEICGDEAGLCASLTRNPQLRTT